MFPLERRFELQVRDRRRRAAPLRFLRSNGLFSQQGFWPALTRRGITALMSSSPRKASECPASPNLSGMPECTREIRGLAHVTKADLDAPIEKEKQAKKSRQGKKK
jgi:hypothetical protein